MDAIQKISFFILLHSYSQSFSPTSATFVQSSSPHPTPPHTADGSVCQFQQPLSGWHCSTPSLFSLFTYTPLCLFYIQALCGHQSKLFVPKDAQGRLSASTYCCCCCCWDNCFHRQGGRTRFPLLWRIVVLFLPFVKHRLAASLTKPIWFSAVIIRCTWITTMTVPFNIPQCDASHHCYYHHPCIITPEPTQFSCNL